MSEYLEFYIVKDTGKTQVYSVDSKRSGARLAVIKWYGPWRQYTLWPERDTIWNSACLRDVNNFIAQLMGARAARMKAES